MALVAQQWRRCRHGRNRLRPRSVFVIPLSQQIKIFSVFCGALPSFDASAMDASGNVSAVANGTLWQSVTHTCKANYAFMPPNAAYPGLDNTSRTYECALNDYQNASEWKVKMANGTNIPMDGLDCLPSKLSSDYK